LNGRAARFVLPAKPAEIMGTMLKHRDSVGYFCEAGVEMWKTQSLKTANEIDLNRSLTTQ
jgi:hypothetical protein